MYHKESFAAIDEAALRYLSGTLREIRYLVVGANNGHCGDPLLAHTSGANWRGTLFEPVPESFEGLQASYAGRASATLRCQAVVADAPGGKRTFHSVPFASVLSSFRREVIEKHARYDGLENVAAEIVPIEVNCVAISELAAEPGFEIPDVLLTDTEGYDYALFEAWWPLGWRPIYARIEVVHLTEAERERIGTALAEAGYELFWYDADVRALRRDAFADEDLRVWRYLRDASFVAQRLVADLSTPEDAWR